MSQRKFVIFLLVTTSLFVFVSQTTAIKEHDEEPFKIFGGGATATQPLIEEWAFALGLDHPIDLRYKAIGSGSGVEQLLVGKFEYTISDSPQPNSFWKKYSGEYLQFPLVAGAIVNVYNLPELSLDNETLILDLDLVALIFQHKVTSWRDKRILDLNPKIKDLLPNKKIQVIVRDDVSGSTEVLSHSLKSMTSKWKLGTFSQWDPKAVKKNDFISASSSFSVYAALEATPYSMSYLGLALLFGTSDLPFARMKVGDEVILPRYEEIKGLMDEVRFDSQNQGSLPETAAKYNVTGVWPLGDFGYALVPLVEDSSSDCEAKRELLHFFRWVLTDSNAQTRARRKGFAYLTPKVSEYVVNLLEKVECDGKRLLAYQEIEQHEGGVYIGLLILSMILMGVMLSLGSFFFFFKDQVRPIAKVYSALLLLGAVIAFLSVIWFYLVPDATWICQLRQWFLGIGFTLFLGALFSRALQIHRIYRSMANSKPSQWLGVPEMIGGSGVSLLLQLIIMIVWSATDELKAKLSVVDQLELTANWVCKSNNIWLWIGLEIAFFSVMLLYGAFVTYMIWDYKVHFTEGKWLLMCIYNLFITLAVFIPLFVTVEVTDDNLFIMVTVGVDFAIIGTLVTLYAQRVFFIIKKTISDVASTGTKDATSSPTQ